MRTTRPAQPVWVAAVDWRRALLSVSLPSPATIEVFLMPRERLLARTRERNTAARIVLEALDPDTSYELDVRWKDKRRRLAFRTLPAPRGRRRFSLALLADPHVSLASENRKGRLFIESRSILRDLLEDLGARDVRGVCLAGDITNKGRPGEYAAAGRLLEGLRVPLYAAPGDHDLSGPGATRAWGRTFGPRAALREQGDTVFVTLDTSSGILGAEGAGLLRGALARRPACIIVVSHLQLFEDDFIRSAKAKVIRDADGHRELLEALTRVPALVYVGHQNVLSRVVRGRLLQLNLPQPVQFPCGYVLLQAFPNGFYHTFEPIRSLALDENSRRATAAAGRLYGEPQWNPSYRLGRDPGQGNFLWDPGTATVWTPTPRASSGTPGCRRAR